MERVKPTFVYHADWSKNAKKRWCATAILSDSGRYLAFGPEKVGDFQSLFRTIRSRVGDTGCALVGFDFPIGIPAFYAEHAGILNFRTFLAELPDSSWPKFFDVCRQPSEISLSRPFYPDGGLKGRKHEELFGALKAPSIHELLRRCERGEGGLKQACCLFWTLGGNQVGKAAIVGWRDLLVAALRSDDPISLWPFDGTLESLLLPGKIVIVETYPAEYYGWFTKEHFGSKRNQSERQKAASPLLQWAENANVDVGEELKSAIEGGFRSFDDRGRNGEDAFDAVVGMFAMLDVVLGHHASGEPRDTSIRNIEGWILGRCQQHTRLSE